MKWLQVSQTGLIIGGGETDEIPVGSEFILQPLQGSIRSVMGKYYWDGVELLPKQHFDLSTVPLPATAEIEESLYPITSLPIEFSFDTPGTYLVKINAGPAYYVEEFQIDNPT